MFSPFLTIDPDKRMEEAVEIMRNTGLGWLVVKETIIYSVFTARDLAEHFNEFEDGL